MSKQAGLVEGIHRRLNKLAEVGLGAELGEGGQHSAGIGALDAQGDLELVVGPMQNPSRHLPPGAVDARADVHASRGWKGGELPGSGSERLLNTLTPVLRILAQGNA